MRLKETQIKSNYILGWSISWLYSQCPHNKHALFNKCMGGVLLWSKVKLHFSLLVYFVYLGFKDYTLGLYYSSVCALNCGPYFDITRLREHLELYYYPI